MERYEINKYLVQLNKEVEDMYIALDIKNNIPILEALEKEISNPDFWLNPQEAQKTINKCNAIKEKVNDYNSIKQAIDDINDLNEMSANDSDALVLLEEEIIKLDKFMQELEVKVTLSGKYDDSDAILELHPGAGGTESMDWADMLYRMYTRYASKKGFKVTVLDYLAGEDAGIKSVTISGKFAYGLLKGERGVHRLVRISPFNAAGKRQTSFVSCDVAPQIKEDNDIIINDEDIRIDTFCSSGPGGQGVNTTYSAVRITHIPTNIVVSCQNERSQIKNKDICMKLLKSKLLELEVQKQEEELKKLKGEQMDIGFGSQIRSYVFCPYTLVKDHRTNYETGNITSVMDGSLDEFINAFLKYNARS